MAALVNLGYSDFQGDEIRALWLPAPGRGRWTSYIARPRPGAIPGDLPVKLVDPTYANSCSPACLLRWLASWQFIFSTDWRACNSEPGSAVCKLFMACNGLFVGLMRIVQYQPFVMLFSILALYCFARQGKMSAVRSRAFMPVSWQVRRIFAHYDGVFIAPFAIYLLYQWYQHWEDLPKATRWRTLVVPAALSALVAGSLLRALPDQAAHRHPGLLGRALHGGRADRLLPSSIYTFQLYNPLLGLPLYAVLGTFP